MVPALEVGCELELGEGVEFEGWLEVDDELELGVPVALPEVVSFAFAKAGEVVTAQQNPTIKSVGRLATNFARSLGTVH
ncbi:hypothetical protein C7B65_14055 [Phormidesmis priestleyi ULC007]|uniref:Uncharacterized protein n=1 Tax=Phormidesmis priestleyi ULC007 TaxID=1920490 RepID=A0A2T1DEH7_9CYAN|nr:hypothetical protein C7B65_14055 [Phormidesmis priestleyi ULC007]PZO50974.1 MAG: hypothetical protein DCF14_09765 [Phormidesmis priestleyi]